MFHVLLLSISSIFATLGSFTSENTTISLPAWEGALPESWDWREHNVVTPVKNQGQCGSCWAFSTVATIESAYAIATGSLVSLSEQELMDCASKDGCGGGLMDDAFFWVEHHKGICSEKEYPYLECDGICHKCKPIVHVKDYVDVTPEDPEALMRAVLQQPVSIAIDAGGMAFQFYQEGVMTGHCGTSLNHGVTLIGYGVENGVPYWIVRNSWGDRWGDAGYIKLERLSKKGPGKCGILLSASYPIIALKNQ